MPDCADVPYRLVGTGAALLHGVCLPAGDIDILVKERADLDAFAGALASAHCLEPPAWLAHSRQYYGSWEIAGAEVQLSTVDVASDSDTIETLGRGPWEHYERLACGAYLVPTVVLELRLITELWRQREDRYGPLIGFLRAHGRDLAFIERGMVGAGVPQELQERVSQRLAASPYRKVPSLHSPAS
jgi:hypothetical protein